MAANEAASLPTGTVTFLFTDIEGSTRLWEERPEELRLALARHDVIVRDAIERHSGHALKVVGDACCAAFASPPDAARAALYAQQALLPVFSPENAGLPVRVR